MQKRKEYLITIDVWQLNTFIYFCLESLHQQTGEMNTSTEGNHIPDESNSQMQIEHENVRENIKSFN